MRKADLIKFISCELSVGERERVSRWLESSEKNREYFEYLKALWLLPMLPEERADESDYMKFKKRFNTAGKKTGKFYYLSFTAVAASVLLFFLLTPYFKSAPDFIGKDKILISNNEAELLYYCMPDGSRISLFRGAMISYGSDFLLKRNILLNGKAYFEIAANHEDPFHVYTSDVDIKVTGTKFIVDGNNEGGFKIFLEEGRVCLKRIEGSKKIDMVPGDIVVMDNGMNFTKISKASLPWEMNILRSDLCFENVSMDIVLKKLSAYYNISFICSDNIRRLLFTGDLKDETLESSLNLFNQTMGLKSSINKNVITLE